MTPKIVLFCQGWMGTPLRSYLGDVLYKWLEERMGRRTDGWMDKWM